jgi:signal transduction histidine kinase
MAGITRTGLSIVFLGLAVLTFSLVWAVYQSHKLARPLEALVAGTGEVIRGNLAHRLSVPSGDEIGQLALAFNRMAEELATAQASMVQKTRMATMGEMAAMVAHETRNPLGALSTCLQLFRRRASGAGEDAELLDIMQAEVRRLTDLVSDFLAFGRPRPLRIESVNLPELIGSLLTLLERDRQVTRGVRVSTALHPEVKTVPADAAQFRQILWNVLLNAAQALDGGGELTVSTAPRDGWVDVTVADTGRGIPAEVLSRIFDPFFTTRTNGSGLGLAVVKRIVDEHGGTIRVESRVGAGTTVVVSLPRSRPSVTTS